MQLRLSLPFALSLSASLLFSRNWKTVRLFIFTHIQMHTAANSAENIMEYVDCRIINNNDAPVHTETSNLFWKKNMCTHPMPKRNMNGNIEYEFVIEWLVSPLVLPHHFRPYSHFGRQWISPMGRFNPPEARPHRKVCYRIGALIWTVRLASNPCLALSFIVVQD